MLDNVLNDLSVVYGRATASALASAYETAILSLSLGQLHLMPDRKVRFALIDAMLAEGQLNGFVSERMAEVALAAVAPAGSDVRF